MDLENPEGPTNVASNDELVIGAVRISERVFDGQVPPRQVYHLLEMNGTAYGAFKILNKWACWRNRTRAKLGTPI